MTLNQDEFKVMVMLYAANIEGNIHSEEVKVMLEKAGSLNDKTVFTEQIIQMSSLGILVQDTTNEYRQHVEYIQNFMSATPESIYENAKKAMASGDQL